MRAKEITLSQIGTGKDITFKVRDIQNNMSSIDLTTEQFGIHKVEGGASAANPDDFWFEYIIDNRDGTMITRRGEEPVYVLQSRPMISEAIEMGVTRLSLFDLKDRYLDIVHGIAAEYGEDVIVHVTEHLGTDQAEDPARRYLKRGATVARALGDLAADIEAGLPYDGSAHREAVNPTDGIEKTIAPATSVVIFAP